MFQTFHSTLAALALSLAAATVQAAPVVPVGSTYGYHMRGEISGYSSVGGVVFDGVAHAFTRTLWDGRTLQMTLNESQQDLGGGKFLIRFDVHADGDMFPYQGPIGDLTNDREYGVMGLGFQSNPVDLLMDVRMDSAVLRAFNGAGTLLADSDMIGFFWNKDPWDGYAPRPNVMVGYGNIGNANTRHLQLDLVVTALKVPEPGALALAGLGLLGLVASRRRRA